MATRIRQNFAPRLLTVAVHTLLVGTPAARAELPVPADAWIGAGQASREVTGSAMTIRQHSDQAILNWQSFDIGRHNAVHFRQPSAAAIALNRIAPGDQPSRILGRLDANGQVYLVNPNGFVFGAGAQVNVNSLTATTLDIGDDAFKAGLTKIIGQSQGSTPLPALSSDGSLYRKDAEGRVVLDATGQPQKIKIEIDKGARLSTNAAGGRILLAAPVVENRGAISAPDGQVILAAATDKVYLQEADPQSNLRGILVEVGTGGEVRNLGKLNAARGNITAIGYAVYQQGRVTASTSVSLNGTLRLLAREGATLDRASDGTISLKPQTTRRAEAGADGLGTLATVTLAGGSRTRIDLDRSGGTAVDEQTQPKSRVEISGGRVLVRNGAAVVAPGGEVAVTASLSPGQPMLATTPDNPARIVLEPGSRIDVSGSRRTVAPMERNVVSVELRNNELRDAPLQKPGVLHGQSVRVDIRKGTPLADISGSVARIRRSVDERNATGGTVALDSEGDVSVQSGANINIAGGSVRYRDGWIATTQLLSDGKLYDIANADPNRHYDGILGQIVRYSPRWNITQTWKIPGPVALGQFEPGYLDGKAAGALSIQSRNVLFDGTLQADTLAGPYQRTTAQRPGGGSLEIDLAWSGQRQQAVLFSDQKTPPVALGDDAPFPGAADGSGTLPPLVLGNALFGQGLRSLTLASAGRIDVDPALTLNVPAQGKLALTGGVLDIQGSIRAPSGTISLATQPGTGNAETLSGDIRVGKNSRLDATGLWVNDLLAEQTTARPDTPLPIDGGKISLAATGNLVLAAGSRIAVDGGAWLKKDSTLSAGQGGDISLKVAAEGPSRLELGAALSGYALQQGGSLALTANAVRIAADASGQPGTTLALTPDFLGSGGFGKLALTANGGDLTVAAGTQIQLQGQTWELRGGYLDRPSGTPMAALTQTTLLPEFYRQPVDLSLSVVHDAKVGQYDPAHRLSLESGAAIHADPGADLSLASDANLWIDGTLDAPSGHIAATINPVNPTLDPGYDPNQAIRLGPSARLLATGATLLQPNPGHLPLGKVEDGGTVDLRANRGYILMDRDALVDTSGTAALLDTAGSGTAVDSRWVRSWIPSDGGAINLTAAEGIVVDGGLRSAPGPAPGAQGGSLSLTLDAQARGLAPDNLPADALPIPTGPRVIHVAQQQAPRLAPGLGPDTPISTNLNGQAYFGAKPVAEGGFASLSLKSAVMVPDDPSAALPGLPERGAIRFEGDVALTAARQVVLDAPVLGWERSAASDRGAVAVTANYVALGSSLNRQGHGDSLDGDATLRVQAGWLDLVGATELAGFHHAALTSRNDIRLLGVNPSQESDLLGGFSTVGALDLAARQIYPATLSQFSLHSDSQVNILPGDPAAKAPLSAGGTLAITAPLIHSQGVLRAPLGEIDLTATQTLTLAPKSLTSVSAAGLVIPFGRTQGDLDWLFPLGAYNQVIGAPPAKTIVLNGSHIDLQAGAKLDIAGGGDLHAFEFVKGPGGSVDQLDPTDPGYADGSSTYQEKYAVVPWLGSRYAPYDPIDSPVSGLEVGDSVYLAGGGGLAAGRYVLLPAHYALLPGAFLVTPQANTTDLHSNYTRLDGAAVVAGYRYTAGTHFHDARWSGFTVEPGAIARTRAEYHEHRANTFFAAKAQQDASAVPLLPKDAGALALSVDRTLTLAGQIAAAGVSGGRGGRLDIAADRLAIVQDAGQAAALAGSEVALAADDLNRLAVESLFIGGRRTENADGTTRLNVQADSVNVQPDTHLQGQEIILAAQNGVSVGANAQLAAQGKPAGNGESLHVDGNGALLRIATGAQAGLLKDAPGATPSTAVVDIAGGATLGTSGSLLLDSGADIHLDGRIAMDGGSLYLGAGRIGLGDTPAASGGLLLNNTQLAGIKAEQWTLASRGPLDLYGAVSLTAKRLDIDSPGLYGHAQPGETARIAADILGFSNTAPAAAATPPDGQGNLVLAARQLRLGPGAYGWQGFRQIDAAATDAIVADGNATLGLGADTHLAAGKLAATAGAHLSLDAGQAAVLIDPLTGGQPAAVADGLGARLDIQAGRIALAGTLAFPAGSVALDAGDGITLAAGASIDAGGRAVALGDSTAYAPGGAVSLRSATGDIAIAAGARVDVSAAPGGGDAGSLDIAAAQGHTLLDGTLLGQAGSGGAGGSFGLDSLGTGALGFPALNAKLQTAGFTQALDLRFRQGDLTLGPGDTLKAHAVHLTADTGSIAVSGTIDAGGKQAGNIELDAGRALSLENGARLVANATAAGAAGGRVALSAMGDGGVHIAPGARIDVAAGADGSGGTVAVRATRLGADDAAVDLAPGTVAGARDVNVEAVRVYPDQAITNANINQWRADTAVYMDAASANPALRSRLGDFTLTPGVEIQASGNLDLDPTETLNTRTWTQVGQTDVWQTRLDGVAGVVARLDQVAADGSARTLTAGISSALGSDGSYFFDADPSSPTFRELFVRVFPDSGLNAADRHHPGLIADTLVEANGWDFLFPTATGATWRFGPQQVPGTLTLRAVGDIGVAQNLSDGFALWSAAQLAAFFQPDSGVVPNWRPTLMLQPGLSWSYRLAAGADLGGADPLAVSGAVPHALVIGAGASIRTGTGSISAAASGDVRFTDAQSTLYTAGRATSLDRYGSFGTALAGKAFYAEYPVDGGAVSLRAGRDILGAPTPQFMSDWLVRTGSWNPDDSLDTKDRPTAWGIAFDNLVLAGSSSDRVQNLKFGFRENLGALGGGNVSLVAGRDIRDLSAMLPTTAQPVGQTASDGRIVDNHWQVRGGGDLRVTAGGDIAGGVFYVERGTASLAARGAVTGGSQYTAGPVFALGDTQFRVTAGQGLAVGAALNPFSVKAAAYPDKTAYFSTYAPDSALGLQTAADDLALNNDTAVIRDNYLRFDGQTPQGSRVLGSPNELAMLSLYPGSLRAAALSGSLAVGHSFELFPAARGALELLAAEDIRLGDTEQVVISQSDADPALLLSPMTPANSLNDTLKRLDIFQPANTDFLHAAEPVHSGDEQPVRVVAAAGDIVAARGSLIATAKPAEILAGRDILGLGLQIQNLGAGDVSEVRAGRDIRFPIVRDPLTGDLDTTIDDLSISVAGPGQLQVVAGRDVDLGTSAGIVTLGHLVNPALPQMGASVAVLAGLAHEPDYAGFIQAYFAQPSDYATALTAYMRALTGEPLLGTATALARFQALAPERQREFILAVLFRELKASGQAAAGTTDPARQAAFYRRGQQAIATLFPGDGYQGDISLFFSKIQTLDGGDIDLLAPGGGIDAGLASAFTGHKAAADLGIVAQREGNIGAYSRDSFQVNQSRVFTLDGGDITVWSSAGDIDAGRGAKAALAAPAPVYGFDAKGNLVVTFPPVVSGSGIRAQSGSAAANIGATARPPAPLHQAFGPARTAGAAGDVTLVAPKGVVDAGEAGIGGHNVAIAATAIIGVANIQASGTLTGAPPVAASFATSLVGAGQASVGATAQAAAAVAQSLEPTREQIRPVTAPVPVNLLAVDLIGFGDCSVADVRQDRCH